MLGVLVNSCILDKEKKSRTQVINTISMICHIICHTYIMNLYFVWSLTTQYNLEIIDKYTEKVD